MKIVTGPGRSGTSLAARILIEAGADFGPAQNHVPADINNPDGYFEDVDFVTINASMAVGTWVDSRRLVLADSEFGLKRWKYSIAKLGYLWAPSPTRLAARADRLSGQIETTANRLAGCFVKCTRLPVCLDPWLATNTVDSILFVYRHPAPVARSMNKAYGLPVVFGVRLWCLRVGRFLDSISDRSDLKVVFADYDRLLSADRRVEETHTILKFFNQDASSAEAEALASSLIRSETSGGTDIFFPNEESARLYDMLRQARSDTAYSVPRPNSGGIR